MKPEPTTNPMKEIFNELFSHLEKLETQSEAILQFLKEKKRVTDKQLAPYLEQAGNASNVRWRAVRIRIEHLLSSTEDKEKEIVVSKPPEIAMAEQGNTEKANKEQAERTDSETADDKADKPKEGGKGIAAQTEKQTDEASQPPSPKAVEPVRQSKDQQSGHRKEDSSHPTEMTEEMAQREGAEPPPELSSQNKAGETKPGETKPGEKKSGDKEAA